MNNFGDSRSVDLKNKLCYNHLNKFQLIQVPKMIRKANINELNEILEIYAYARGFMAQNGNPTQWGNTTPKIELLIENINDG